MIPNNLARARGNDPGERPPAAAMLVAAAMFVVIVMGAAIVLTAAAALTARLCWDVWTAIW